MQGTMLWFNVEKGHGFIQTEQEERLYVARGGFLPGHDPEPRCNGRAVRFEREVVGGDARAFNVSFVAPLDPRRARLHHGRGGHPL
jgi:cold shock CspA family protein